MFWTQMCESPRLLIMVALILEVITLLWWAFVRSRKSALALLAGPVIFCLAFVLDFAVETNREQAQRLTRQIVQAAEDENAQQIIDLLSPSIEQMNGWFYQQICDRIWDFCSRPLIQTNYISDLTVDYADDRAASVHFSVVTQLDPQSEFRMYTSLVKTEWRFDFTRQDKQPYYLYRFTMLSLNNDSPVDILTLRHRE